MVKDLINQLKNLRTHLDLLGPLKLSFFKIHTIFGPFLHSADFLGPVLMCTKIENLLLHMTMT